MCCAVNGGGGSREGRGKAHLGDQGGSSGAATVAGSSRMDWRGRLGHVLGGCRCLERQVDGDGVELGTRGHREDDEEGRHGESGVPASREGDPDNGEQPHEDVELDDAGELLREVVADEGRKVEVRSHLQQHARNAERVASQCVWYASHGGSPGAGQNAQTLLNPEFFRMQGWRWRL